MGESIELWPCDGVSERINSAWTAAGFDGELITNPSGRRELALDGSDPETLRRQVRFIMENRMLFESIVGLQHARRVLEMEDAIPGDLDGYEFGLEIRVVTATFDELPEEPNDPIYAVCRHFRQADLWARYLEFRRQQSEDSWNALKECLGPSSALGPDAADMRTIESRCRLIQSSKTEHADDLPFPSLPVVMAAIQMPSSYFNELAGR